LLQGVYRLPQRLTPRALQELTLFVTKVADFVEGRLQTFGLHGVMIRDNGRLEFDLGFLRSLRRDGSRLRTKGQHPMLSDSEECRSALSSIEILIEECQAGLQHIGAQNTRQWSYHAYGLLSPPNTPAQERHKDRGMLSGLKYVTCILPLSERAELTEFSSGEGYLTFPGFIMFDGHVQHRGPSVGSSRRLALAVVACAAARDINNEFSLPFRNGAADWTEGGEGAAMSGKQRRD
jgi:hypothetical protein